MGWASFMFLVFSMFGGGSAGGKEGRLVPADARVRLVGTSTMHDWEMDVADPQVNAGWQSPIQEPKDIKEFKFTAQAKNLKADYESMESKARDALRAQKHPLIVFTLKKVEKLKKRKPQEFEFLASGQLEAAGESKVEFVGGTVFEAGQELVFEGEFSINMRDYGIKPPSFMFFNTGEIVKVKFKLPIKKDDL